MFARLLQACVSKKNSLRYTRNFQSVYQEHLQTRACYARKSWVRSPLYLQHTAEGLELVLRDKFIGVHESVLKDYFIYFVVIRQRKKRLCISFGAMQLVPCLKTDTAFSPSVPKENFPHREGST